MPIVNSEVWKVLQKQPGRIKVMERHTDHTGKVWDYRYNAPADVDQAATLITNAANLEATFRPNEHIRAAQKLKSSGITDTPVYSTQAEFDRGVLFELMTEADPRLFLGGLPFYQEVSARGGANANARAAYLGVTRAVWDQIAKRFSDVQGAAFFINVDKGQIWLSTDEGDA